MSVPDYRAMLAVALEEARLGTTEGGVTMDKIFITAESLLRDSMELALQIIQSGFRPTFLLAMWRGGAPIGITVQEVLEYHGIQADHVGIRTSSYLDIDKQSNTVRVHAVDYLMDYLISRLQAHDQLLLVDDVFDSGRSVEAVLAELRRRCRRNLPEQIRTATVYYKPQRNRSSIVPDYHVRATNHWLVFPHEVQGLTRAEILRHKPVDERFFAPPPPQRVQQQGSEGALPREGSLLLAQKASAD